MEAKEAIAKLRTDLVAVQKDGLTTVSVEALQSYLVHLESDASSSLELHKLEQQRGLAQYDATSKQSLEMFRSIVEAGREALNASLLINGGAVVAVLSFLGATLNKGMAGTLAIALTQSLLAFGFGVLFSAIGFGARYVTQYSFGNEWLRLGRWLNRFSILLVVASYTAFGAGVCGAYLAFTSFFAAAP